MKSHPRWTSLLIGLLIIATLISACSSATAATAPSAPLAAAPAQPAAVAFDIKPTLEKFFTNMPDSFYGIKNADALKALQAEPKPFVVDVREAKEITQTIESAVNIPLRSLTQNLDKLPAKDQAILVYCGIGHRGGITALVLQMLGYTNVRSILGGFNGWKAAGLPVKEGGPVAPSASGVAVNVDKDLLAVFDKFLTAMPDDFYVGAPTAIAKKLAADPKPMLIDVREPKELTDSGYIDGAVNIPIRDLFKNLDKLPQDKNAPIVTYCAIGHRGAMAMAALRLLGYTNVTSIGSGFNNWVKAGLPVKK